VSTPSVRTLEMRQSLPGLVPSRRPAHAIIPVRDGDVVKALKDLKKYMDFTGTFRVVRRRADGFVGHAETRRRKSRAARGRAAKALKRRELAMAD
jgi:ribosomal protein S21